MSNSRAWQYERVVTPRLRTIFVKLSVWGEGGVMVEWSKLSLAIPGAKGARIESEQSSFEKEFFSLILHINYMVKTERGATC